jgi:REP element-mobilizing transposase RayT
LYKEGCTYFVTFCLIDARPPTTYPPGRTGQPRRSAATSSPDVAYKATDPTPSFDTLAPETIAANADVSPTLGSCRLRRPDVAELVQNAIRFFNGQRYHLYAWCVMPNHVHAVLTPLTGHGLKAILHSWKSYAANQANRLLGTRGAFWERESFDHAIRSGDHLARFIRYTEENPMTAGLCSRAEDWPWSSCESGRT